MDQNKTIKFNFLVRHLEMKIYRKANVHAQICGEKYWGLKFVDNITAIHSG